MFSNFECTSSSKWILCGEHAVIRGYPAIVFPLKQKQLTLHYSALDKPLQCSFSGTAGADLNLLFWNVIAEAFKLLEKDMHTVQGHILIENQIPIGTGLGASAALSITISRWLIDLNLLPENECFSFSQKIENLFHKNSSGLDIAGCMSSQGVIFQKGKTEPLQLNWAPQWYLSFSGPVGITSHCVNHVETLIKDNPSEGVHLDEQMANSVLLAKQALMSTEENRLAQLQSAIEMASNSFNQWGLINADVKAHMNWLKENGAIATKPTGSGNGGFTLSLWEHQPPDEVLEKLIAV